MGVRLAILLLLLHALPAFTQTVAQVRWPSKYTAAPVTLPPAQAGWLPAFRLALLALPEETIVTTSLLQSPLLGVENRDARRLQTLFSNQYSMLRRTKEFARAPSALPYCFSETKPGEGLATVYLPAKVQPDSPAIVFVHGFGGSLLAYQHFLSTVFPDRVIISPAYGVTPGNVPAEYLDEALQAVARQYSLSTHWPPLLIGLSAGGVGASRVYGARPTAYRRLICLGSVIPADAMRQFPVGGDLRFAAGSAEMFAINGTFEKQMRAIKSRVKNCEWKTVNGADHFFLLSHQEQSGRMLKEWGGN